MTERRSSAPQAPANIGEYRLIERIGQGAMGSIFLARDTLLERDVALKLLAADELDGDARALFLREARALARVSHPNVVTVHRVGEFEQHTYLVTELVQGRSLEDMAKPIPWQRALVFGVGIALGLAAAHRKNVLHRDIKPANVMVSVDGDVKVVDFGLAKLLGESEWTLDSTDAPHDVRGRWSRVSKSGQFVGTPLYMAPEVLHGEASSERSDIYSVGALLYELVAGIAPRDHLPEDAPLRNWIDFTPKALDEREGLAVNARFSQIVQRCLARLPAERFGSAEALGEALDAVHDDQQSGEIPEGNPYRGLEPFEMEHRGVFFGRDVEIRAVEQRLRKESFVVVAGDSGVGKSSLCKAGVLPRLSKAALEAGRKLRTLSFVPGQKPLRAMQDALAPLLPAGSFDLRALLESDHAALYREMTRGLPTDQGVLLFVDQLEELCTISDREEAELAADALMRACAGPLVRVLATLRGDFITQMASLGTIGPVLAQSLFLLRPMTEEGIRAAIVKPAMRKGVTFESEELVDDLVRASVEMPGGLPLLEFALAEIWQARESSAGALTKQALRSIGSVSGALARHADSVLNTLGLEEKAAARRVLLSLTHMKRTRARRTWDELGGHQPAVRIALDALVQGRLIVARQFGEEGGVYEVAHEALLWEWQTLREWIEQTREQGQTAREIEEAAELWDRRGRLEDETWVGAALARAAHAVEKWDIDLPTISREFLAAGLVRQSNMQRRRRWFFGTAATVLVVVATGSTMAAFAFAEKERVAIRQQEQIRLAAADMGQFEFVIETFDWNATTQKPTWTAISPTLDWRLHAVSRGDSNSPGKPFGPDDVRRSERRVEGNVLRERVEARSGTALLEVMGRGEGCQSSWIRLQGLPGYTDRATGVLPEIRIVVPTCQATKEDMVEIPAGEFYWAVALPPEGDEWRDEIASLPLFFMDRTEVTQGAYAVYSAMERLTGDRAARVAFMDMDRPGAERLPIIGINASMAANYCRFMGKALPSTKQWAKAMRGGLMLASGPNPMPRRDTPWVNATSKYPRNIGEAGDGFQYLAPVQSFPLDVSPYGVVDMGGNAREWTSELVQLPQMAGLRYVFGASWDSPPDHADWCNMREERSLEFTIGIRCVR